MADAMVVAPASAGVLGSSGPPQDEATDDAADRPSGAVGADRAAYEHPYSTDPSRTPPPSPPSSRGSSVERSPSVTPSQIGRGMKTMARTPGNRARRRPVPPDGMGGHPLHVDVPPSANMDVLKILDAVPFTPSQGVKTPSPRSMAAVRTAAENTESGPSRLSMMENRDSMVPSPPFSPTSRFDLYGMVPSPPYSPTYNAVQYNQAGMMPDANMAAAMNSQMQGQLLHQMYFGYSGSPPSPSAAAAAWQGATSPVEYGPPSPTSFVQMPAVYAQQMPAVYVAHQMAPQPVAVPPIYAAALPHSLFPTDYSMSQNFQAAPGGMSMPGAAHSMMHNQVPQHRVQSGPPGSGGANGRRNHLASRFRVGTAGQANPPRPPNVNAASQLQSYAMAQARAQNLRQNAPRASPDSSPNSSSNGSPNASQSGQGADAGKPRMNARQRRTERRRRERDIKSITDHLKNLEEAGGGLAGEDRRLFEFQLSEVQTLMEQVQKQQQDTGEGVLIEYHLRKLRDLLHMDQTQCADADTTLSNESSPNNTRGSIGQLSPGARAGLSPDRAAGVMDELGAKLKDAIALNDGASSKVPPTEPEKGLDGDSPLHPSTPQTQQAQPVAQRA